MESEILFKVEDGLAFLSLNRSEKRNSLNGALLQKMMEALLLVEANSDIKALVLNSSIPAPGAFCSGADLAGIGNLEQAKVERKLFCEILKKMRTFTKPTIAHVSGACMGGGVGLALSCDFVFAGPGASFCTPEVLLGLYPLMISPLIYENCKSKKEAEAFILTGKKISSDEALHMGLVTAVGTEEEIVQKIGVLMAGFKRLDHSVLALAKKVVEESAQLSFNQKVDRLGETLDEIFAMPSTQQKIQSFLKRDRA